MQDTATPPPPPISEKKPCNTNQRRWPMSRDVGVISFENSFTAAARQWTQWTSIVEDQLDRPWLRYFTLKQKITSVIQRERNCDYDRKYFGSYFFKDRFLMNFWSWDMSENQIIIIYDLFESRPWLTFPSLLTSSLSDSYCTLCLMHAKPRKPQKQRNFRFENNQSRQQCARLLRLLLLPSFCESAC